MIRNYFKVLVKNLRKNSLYTFINILGLSLGITGGIIIFAIIDFESNFDRHHQDLDKIYRVITAKDRFGTINHTAGIAFQLPEEIRTQFPSVEYAVTVNNNWDEPVIENSNNPGKRFIESNAAYVEKDYFKIFTYDFLYGDPQQALESEESIVITEEVAKKYFGRVEVLNEILTVNDSIDLAVTGVIKKPPLNSNLPFNIFCAFGEKARREYSHWSWSSTSASVQCFVKVKSDADIGYIGEGVTTLFAEKVKDEVAEGVSHTFTLQPMSDVHFDDRIEYSFGPVFSQKGLLALGLIGVFLVITACINFINLNTVLISKRSKEIGVRKTMGASKGQITFSVLFETGVIVLLSILVSFGIGEIAFIYIDSLVGHSLELDVFSNPKLLAFSSVLFVLVTVLAGVYPAWISSTFKPVDSLKYSLNQDRPGSMSVRKGLVIIQFVISQALIVGTLVVLKQINYFQSVPLGFEHKAIIEVPIPDGAETVTEFKSELKRKAGVQNVTVSNTGAISSNTWFGTFELSHNDELLEEYAQVKFIDQDYFDTYGISFLEGVYKHDTSTIRMYVNERLLEKVGILGSEDIQGSSLEFWGWKGSIEGIIKNHNTVSLHNEIDPVVYIPRDAWSVAAIKLSTNSLGTVLPEIQQVWEASYPTGIFTYTFLDDRIAALYENEKRTSNLLMTFSITAIIIGIIGLFGLVSFVAELKTKEIGIRKVLGARIDQVLYIFLKEFTILVIIAFAISIPISFYFLREWLNGFSYRIELGPGIFLSGLLISFLIAIATVSYRSIRAASVNPVKSLRSE